MTKEQIREAIEEIGIVPAIRVSSPDDVLFAAESLSQGGIPIIEITMTVPNAIEVVSELARSRPRMIVGAGTVLDADTAQRCIDAGANFLTSTGLDLDVVKLARANDILVFPGALTPTEVMMAWKAGSDFVKVFPCAQVGGARYIRALAAPFPQVRLIAAGGVNQETAGGFITAGAAAIGIGSELVPREAIKTRQADWICELARRYLSKVRVARSALAGTA